MTKWKEIRQRRTGDDPAANERIRREKVLLDMEVALAALRKRQGFSQRELAEALGTSQPNIARIEREEDVRLSTLAGYIDGIGGRLAVLAIFDDDTVHLTSEGVAPEVTLTTINPTSMVCKGAKLMASGNDSDRQVVPNKEKGGWDVKKEKAGRSSAHTDTKKEAQDRAREIVRNNGGGEIRIHDKDGVYIDSDTVKGPKRGESPARDRK